MLARLLRVSHFLHVQHVNGSMNITTFTNKKSASGNLTAVNECGALNNLSIVLWRVFARFRDEK
jgi:hypothetical protein